MSFYKLRWRKNYASIIYFTSNLYNKNSEMKFLVLLILCYCSVFITSFIDCAPTPSPSPYMAYSIRPLVRKDNKKNGRLALLKKKGNWRKFRWRQNNSDFIAYSEIRHVQQLTLQISTDWPKTRLPEFPQEQIKQQSLAINEIKSKKFQIVINVIKVDQTTLRR